MRRAADQVALFRSSRLVHLKTADCGVRLPTCVGDVNAKTRWATASVTRPAETASRRVDAHTFPTTSTLAGTRQSTLLPARVGLPSSPHEAFSGGLTR